MALRPCGQPCWRCLARVSNTSVLRRRRVCSMRALPTMEPRWACRKKRKVKQGRRRDAVGKRQRKHGTFVIMYSCLASSSRRSCSKMAALRRFFSPPVMDATMALYSSSYSAKSSSALRRTRTDVYHSCSRQKGRGLGEKEWWEQYTYTQAQAQAHRYTYKSTGTHTHRHSTCTQPHRRTHTCRAP